MLYTPPPSSYGTGVCLPRCADEAAVDDRFDLRLAPAPARACFSRRIGPDSSVFSSSGAPYDAYAAYGCGA